jgi:O-antigen/teichoic acid export membrane protein
MNLKKFSLSLVLTILIKFVSIALGLYTARWSINYIPSRDLADFNIILGFITTIVTIITFGLPVIIQRHYTNTKSPEKDGNFWTTAMFVRLFSFPIGILLCVVFVGLTGVNNLPLTLATFCMSFVLISDLSFRSITDAKGNSWQYSLSDLVGKIALVVFLIFSINTSLPYPKVYLFIGSSILAYLIALLIDGIWQKKHYTFGKLNFDLLKKLSKPIFYFSLIATLTALYSSTDKIFLGRFGFPAEVINGYSNAYKLFEIAVVVIGLSTPMLASYAKNQIQNKNLGRLENYFKKLTQKLGIDFSDKKIKFCTYLLANIIIGTMSSIGLFLIGPLVLKFIDSSNLYPQAYVYLPILAIGVIPLSVVLYLGYMIGLYGGEKYEMFNYIFVCSFGLLLYTILIPRFGGVGAAIATNCIFVCDILGKSYIIFRNKLFSS